MTDDELILTLNCIVETGVSYFHHGSRADHVLTRAAKRIAELKAELATAREKALTEAADAVNAMKDGLTATFDGGMIEDVDGPWFMKSQMYTTIRNLVANPEARK